MSYEILRTIKLKNDEELRIATKEYKGVNYIDMRIYFKSEIEKGRYEYLPSKKGLTLNREIALQFSKVLVNSLIQSSKEVEESICEDCGKVI